MDSQVGVDDDRIVIHHLGAALLAVELPVKRLRHAAHEAIPIDQADDLLAIHHGQATQAGIAVENSEYLLVLGIGRDAMGLVTEVGSHPDIGRYHGQLLCHTNSIRLGHDLSGSHCFTSLAAKDGAILTMPRELLPGGASLYRGKGGLCPRYQRRQGNRHAESAVLTVAGDDATPQAFDHARRNGQTQAVAIGRTLCGAAEEGLED